MFLSVTSRASSVLAATNGMTNVAAHPLKTRLSKIQEKIGR